MPGQYHLADQHTCSCYDFVHRRTPCKHVLAVRLHCELARFAMQPRRRSQSQADRYADIFKRFED